MADHIAVMNLGVLQQYGTPAEIYDSPANRFVAGFVGSTQMNFLPPSVAARAAACERRRERDRRRSARRACGSSPRTRPDATLQREGHPRRAARGEGRRPPLARRPRRAGDRHVPDSGRGSARTSASSLDSSASTSSTTRPARRSADGDAPAGERDEAVRQRDRSEGRLARDRGRRVLRGARPARRRQDDAAADDRRPRAAGGGRCLRRRRARSPTSTPATGTSRSCSRTSRSIPDKTVFGNLAFPLKQRKLPKDEINERVQKTAALAAHRASAQAQAREALGRRAAARRARPRARPRPARVPLRRAALGAGRAAAPRDAGGAEAPPARSAAARWSTSRTTRSRR